MPVIALLRIRTYDIPSQEVSNNALSFPFFMYHPL